MDANKYEIKMESNKTTILYNAIQTPDGTVLESKHRHDFVCHIDANGKRYCVDGGRNYLRRVCEDVDYQDISLMDEGDHEVRRDYLKWGVNYDKDGNYLVDGPDYRKIKDLDTDHIENIIKRGFVDHLPFYYEVFTDELKYRRDVKTSS